MRKIKDDGIEICRYGKAEVKSKISTEIGTSIHIGAVYKIGRIKIGTEIGVSIHIGATTRN